MKRFYSRCSLLSAFFFMFFLNGLGEGTKELMPDQTIPTRILLDPQSGRDPFALYSAYLTYPEYRLFIHIENPLNEVIYFGTGQQRIGSGSNATETQVTWRIHKPDGTVECQGLTPISNAPFEPFQGYISTYVQAVAGPDAIDPAGYDALVCTPTVAGDYFITWEAGSTRTFDYTDITVANTSTPTPTAIPGRVFAKCWQLRNPQIPGGGYYTMSGKLFIYSNDGIVTRFDPNNFEGRDFSVTSNESGCYPVDATHNAQQARRSQPGGFPAVSHNYPQYKIFLNDPDINVYPDGVIGHLVAGSVSSIPNCNGTITFNFETAPANAQGTSEIILMLSSITPQPTPPYVDRILLDNLTTGGVHNVTWDGKDGNGVSIPNGTIFPFTMRYTNGLTNLPLWDVEDNLHGFKVNLVRPVQVPPLDDPAFYWDDQLIGGVSAATVNINPPGCTDNINGCHGWGDSPWPFPYDENDWGNEKTINTWWYLVSNSSDTIQISYIKSPGALLPVNPEPSSVCQGGTATFTVMPEVSSTAYRWVWDGGSDTTILPTITITFPPTITPGTSHVYVYGMNDDCPDGPPLDISFTIFALPNASIVGPDPVCSGSIQVYSTATGMSNYIWTVTGGSYIGQGTPQVTVTWGASGTGSLSVHYIDLTGCGAITPTPKVITIDPLPAVTQMTSIICSGATFTVTPVNGTNGVVPAGTTYSWPAPAVTGGLLGGAAGSNSSNITGSLTNPTSSVQTATYTVTPNAGTCTGISFQVMVTVNPKPAITDMTTSTCSSVAFSVTPADGVNGLVPPGTTYTWNAPVVTGGLTGGAAGSGTTISGTLLNPTSVSQTATYAISSSTPGCTGNTFNLTVTVNPKPAVNAMTASACSEATFTVTPLDFTNGIVPAGTNYSWGLPVVTGGMTGGASGSGAGNITGTLTNPTSQPQTATYSVTPSVGSCSGAVFTVTITVNPKPAVSMISCFDAVTTKNARRFQLKGGNPPYLVTGSPLQGIYVSTPATPALQADASGKYYFNPSLAAINTYQITYRYTNQFGCINTSAGPAITITVVAGTAACGATMTDPRDNKVYKTATLAGRCWMTENLNYSKNGAVTGINIPMTDNCLAEKYCPPSDATCSGYGGYYQWDELIQYGNTDAPYQGVCPPAWHVPTEAEWQNLIDFIDPVFTSPSANALVGSELKDPAKAFRAMLQGVNYLNSGTWTFTSGTTATMFWTSTLNGTSRSIARGLNDPYNTSISRYSSSHGNAFPVRCIKD